ncbi:MAG: hypothetical protein ACKOZW_12935 [Cyanobium sp.]
MVNEIDAALQKEQDARITIAQLQEIQEAEQLLAQCGVKPISLRC